MGYIRRYSVPADTPPTRVLERYVAMLAPEVKLNLPTSLAFHPDPKAERAYVTNSGDGTLSVIDTTTYADLLRSLEARVPGTTTYDAPKR